MKPGMSMNPHAAMNGGLANQYVDPMGGMGAPGGVPQDAGGSALLEALLGSQQQPQAGQPSLQDLLAILALGQGQGQGPPGAAPMMPGGMPPI